MNLGEYEHCGYTIGGPMVGGFVDWLAQALQAEPVDQILFLARDARVLYDAWQIRRPQALRAVRADYWTLSRRALQMATFEPLDEGQVQFLASRLKRLTGAQILAALHLPPNNDLAEVRPRNEQALKDFLYSLQPMLAAQSEKELEGMQRFLTATVKGRRVALVDVGWHGTLQNLIAHPKLWRGCLAPAIKGYYLGLLTPGTSRVGFACDPVTIPQNIPALAQLVYFIEAFTAGSELSLVSFEAIEEQGYRPIFAKQTLTAEQQQIFAFIRSGVMRFVQEHKDPLSLEQSMQAVLHSGLRPDAKTRTLLESLPIGTFGEFGCLPLLDRRLLKKALYWPPALAQLIRTTLWPGAVWQELPWVHRKLALKVAPHATRKIETSLKTPFFGKNFGP